MEYTTGSVVFNDWIITREIGQGAAGKVYEIKKNGVGQEIRSALKVVMIPSSNSIIENLVSEGMARTDVANYFKEFVEKVLYEVKIMIALREHPNIVAYEGHCVLSHEDGIGWDILIKMELLTSLQEWLSNHLAYGRTMIRMGKEISSALMYMLDHNLIHRNIKPDNIFVDSSETFKLGGFGVTTTIEDAINNPGKVGTESYMAPEVYFGKKYNAQIDIYSLGMVLYKSQNSNRLPFYPFVTEKLIHSDRETALMKRMQGKTLPEPVDGSKEFKAIILKACEYLPKNRYATMKELHDDLKKIEEMESGIKRQLDRSVDYTIGTAVYNDWIITREIGQGATDHVYEIKKNGYGEEIRSALKVIRIPKSPSDIKAVMSEGMTQEDVTDYFKGFVDEILHEIGIMVSLKDHPNIVTYEDHCVITHGDEIGWDILIKMELLTPLQEWQMEHPMNETEVVRLGCEISSALAYAADHHLIHRDVKPENIFVDSMGRFKLGDFGIARTIEKTTGGFSKKGTESYMAPEVYHGKQYNTQVDIYSLGIVLYRFLNYNRLPFYPPINEKITYSDRETALMKRVQGLAIPEPINGSAELKTVVLKACEYLPEKRYASISELHNELQKQNRQVVYNIGRSDYE